MKRITSLLLCAAMCAGLTGTYSSVSANSEPLVLKESSKLVLDKDSGYISRISIGTTVDELVSEFTDTDGITVEKDGSALSGEDEIASGYTVSSGEESYACAVTGDIDGNGTITISDVSAILKHIAKWNVEIHTPAIDANLDGKNTIDDAVLLLKYIAKWDVNIGVFDVVYSEEKITAEKEDTTLSVSVLDNMQKIDRRDPEIGDSATIRMMMSRNEIESCQVYLASDGGHENLSISYTEFANGTGGTIETELFMHHYVSSESVEDPDVKVQYPDAMIPVSEFDIKDGYSQGFLLKAKPDKEVAPGLYESKVTVKNSSGNTIKVVKVYAEVWDLTLPDESSCATAFGLSRAGLYMTHKQYEGDDGLLYKNYYDYMLENRISAYHLPYEFSDPRFEDYMYDPRVSSFCVDGCQSPYDLLTDEELSELYEKYGDNDTWNQKAYYYYVDEPSNYEAALEVKTTAERLFNLVPNARNVVPIIRNPWYDGVDQFDFLSDSISLWCPVSSFFTSLEDVAENDPRVFSKESVEKYGTAEERFAGYMEKGDELWWYVCVRPMYPYANFFVNYQGELSRVLFWQQYYYGSSGCLYWAVNHWVGEKIWRTADNEFYSGDGLLLYPGSKYGIYGPISSIRIEYIRDGIEDFEYLTMAEELCGEDAVNEVLSTVTTGILEYTDDSAVIEAAKIALAEMIMANQ